VKRRLAVVASSIALTAVGGAALTPSFASGSPAVIVPANAPANAGCIVLPALGIAICLPG
jgi:hypothetical protein